MTSTSTMLSYQGHAIREKAETLSLTDMWKASGSDKSRQPSEWLGSADGKRFCETAAELLKPGISGFDGNMGIPQNELVHAVRGGKSPGTWAHWQVAFAYAKYLSPDFHMWCNDVVRAHMEARNGLPSGTSLMHVEQTLARLEAATETQIGGLHGHLKNGLGGRLTNMAEYLHERLWNQYTREVRIIRALDHVVALLTGQSQRTIDRNDAFVPGDWADVAAVRRIAGCSDQLLKPRALNARMINSLDDFCVDMGRWADSSRDPHGRRCRIWRKTAVAAWLDDRGRALIDQHMTRNSAQTVIQFPGNSKGEGK